MGSFDDLMEKHHAVKKKGETPLGVTRSLQERDILFADFFLSSSYVGRMRWLCVCM